MKARRGPSYDREAPALLEEQSHMCVGVCVLLSVTRFASPKTSAPTPTKYLQDVVSRDCKVQSHDYILTIASERPRLIAMSTQDAAGIPFSISSEQQSVRLIELPQSLLDLIHSSNPPV